MMDKTYPFYRMRRDIRSFQPLLLTRVIWQLRKWDLIFSEQASQYYMQTLVKATESMLLIDPHSEVGQIMARLMQATKESQEATMRLIEALP